MIDFNELSQQFILGNLAILGNACLLPLYPGLIAFLAGNSNEKQSFRSSALLGVLVLSGVLTMMVMIGALLFFIQSSFGGLLGVVLPAIYLVVIAFGIALLSGRNIFAKLQTAQAPMLRNRYITAYLYGLLFGPMTLPCTGPIITTAFLLGTADGGSLATELVYFLSFGVGFGWPLLLLPLLALPLQRRIVGWLSQHHDVLTRASGVLLIAIGVFGFITEIVPQFALDFELDQTTQLLYWAVALALTLSVGWFIYQRETNEDAVDMAQTAS